jgi:ABC-type dipeptide/oligopeptide/nickel transport system permease component
MAKFLARRVLSIFISIIGATIFIFILTRLGPDPLTLFIGDAQVELSPEQIQLIKEQLGLDKSLPLQYLTWVWNLMRFDMGQSIGTLRPVSEIIRIHIAVTLILAVGAWTFAIAVGISIGVLAAVKRATFWDYIGRTFALMGQATPQFWSGVLAIFFFAVLLRQWFGIDFFPTGGIGEYDGFPLHWGNAKHYILPCIVLGWPASAGIMRLTRSSMLEILDSEYIKLARAKGVGPFTIIWKHGLRNALIPAITYAGVTLGGLVTGSVVVETVFAWPGTGLLAVEAVQARDYQVVQAVVLFMASIFIASNLVVDVLYAYLDPRIRYN